MNRKAKSTKDKPDNRAPSAKPIVSKARRERSNAAVDVTSSRQGRSPTPSYYNRASPRHEAVVTGPRIVTPGKRPVWCLRKLEVPPFCRLTSLDILFPSKGDPRLTPNRQRTRQRSPSSPPADRVRPIPTHRKSERHVELTDSHGKTSAHIMPSVKSPTW